MYIYWFHYLFKKGILYFLQLLTLTKVLDILNIILWFCQNTYYEHSYCDVNDNAYSTITYDDRSSDIYGKSTILKYL